MNHDTYHHECVYYTYYTHATHGFKITRYLCCVWHTCVVHTPFLTQQAQSRLPMSQLPRHAPHSTKQVPKQVQHCRH